MDYLANNKNIEKKDLKKVLKRIDNDFVKFKLYCSITEKIRFFNYFEDLFIVEYEHIDDLTKISISDIFENTRFINVDKALSNKYGIKTLYDFIQFDIRFFVIQNNAYYKRIILKYMFELLDKKLKDRKEKSEVRISKKPARGVDYSIYEYCKDVVGFADIEGLAKKVKLSSKTIVEKLKENKNYIVISNKKFNEKSNIFYNDEEEYLKNFADREFKRGYSTSKKFYAKMLEDECLKGFLQRNQITDSKDMSYILKKINSDIEGGMIFLYKKNSKVKTVEDVVIDFYKCYFDRKDVNKLIKIYGFSESTTDIINGLLEKQKIYQLDNEEYINAEGFDIDSGKEKEIVKYFNDIYKEYNYIVPNEHLEYIENNFRDMKYNYNQYFIASILGRNGYRKIYRYNMNYNSEIYIMVKNTSKYHEIQDLIYDIIKNKYNGNMNEKEIYNYLSGLGIYSSVTNEREKHLNSDALYGDRIKVDAIGNVVLVHK